MKTLLFILARWKFPSQAMAVSQSLDWDAWPEGAFAWHLRRVLAMGRAMYALLSV